MDNFIIDKKDIKEIFFYSNHTEYWPIAYVLIIQAGLISIFLSETP